MAELGYSTKVIEFRQPRRLRGVSKNNFYTLYDIAWLGITSHSKVPLRIASILGLLMSFISAAIAILYLVLKLLFWDAYPVGFAPVIIGMFFMFGVVLPHRCVGRVCWDYNRLLTKKAHCCRG